MKIGLDIDGVLADFGTHFLEYLDYEDKSPPKEWDDPRFRSGFKKIKDDPVFWTTIPTLINPSEINFKLSCYCTARPFLMTIITMEWLWKNGFPYAPLINVGFNGKKSKRLKSIDLFLDDGLHNYKDLNNNGIKCYLMSRSHNLKDTVDKRVNNFEEFNQVIKNGKI